LEVLRDSVATVVRVMEEGSGEEGSSGGGERVASGDLAW
jgi:hypothetical protein